MHLVLGDTSLQSPNQSKTSEQAKPQTIVAKKFFKISIFKNLWIGLELKGKFRWEKQRA